jgi:hypothetical protein
MKPLQAQHGAQSAFHFFGFVCADAVVIVCVQLQAKTASLPLKTIKRTNLTIDVAALVGAIFRTTLYITATTSACPVTRTSSAGVKTGAIVPAATLSLDAFFELFAVPTLFQNEWLTSRKGQELSSWA